MDGREYMTNEMILSEFPVISTITWGLGEESDVILPWENRLFFHKDVWPFIRVISERGREGQIESERVIFLYLHLRLMEFPCSISALFRKAPQFVFRQHHFPAITMSKKAYIQNVWLRGCLEKETDPLPHNPVLLYPQHYVGHHLNNSKI